MTEQKFNEFDIVTDGKAVYEVGTNSYMAGDALDSENGPDRVYELIEIETGRKASAGERQLALFSTPVPPHAFRVGDIVSDGRDEFVIIQVVKSEHLGFDGLGPDRFYFANFINIHCDEDILVSQRSLTLVKGALQ